MQCDMCGKEVDFLKDSVIEGVTMKVCSSCSKFGTPVKKPDFSSKVFQNKKKYYQNPDENISLKSGYGSLIKSKRESLGIKQEDLAKMISEKSSIIHKIESSNVQISLSLARKIQRVLKINLLVEQKKESVDVGHDSSGLTLGDLIKKKLRN